MLPMLTARFVRTASALVLASCASSAPMPPKTADPAAAQSPATVASAPALPAPTAKCSSPEFRQFDFWVGDWDTFESDHSAPGSIARTHVDPIAGACAIHELYEQTDGLIGDSILSYDPVKKAWQQTWVSNRGSIMVITGAFKDGAVTMEGESHQRDGKTVLQRITWRAEGSGVQEYSTWSKDGGTTWEPAFDVTFERHE